MKKVLMMICMICMGSVNGMDITGTLGVDVSRLELEIDEYNFYYSDHESKVGLQGNITIGNRDIGGCKLKLGSELGLFIGPEVVLGDVWLYGMIGINSKVANDMEDAGDELWESTGIGYEVSRPLMIGGSIRLGDMPLVLDGNVSFYNMELIGNAGSVDITGNVLNIGIQYKF